MIDAGSVLAFAASVAMGAAPLRTAVSDGVMQVAMCGGSSQSLPTQRRDGNSDCPGACHAACARNVRAENDEDTD